MKIPQEGEGGGGVPWNDSCPHREDRGCVVKMMFLFFTSVFFLYFLNISNCFHIAGNGTAWDKIGTKCHKGFCENKDTQILLRVIMFTCEELKAESMMELNYTGA